MFMFDHAQNNIETVITYFTYSLQHSFQRNIIFKIEEKLLVTKG